MGVVAYNLGSPLREGHLKALVKLKNADGHMRVLDVPEPEPTSSQVLVKIRYCGICGTDVKIFHDHHYYYRAPAILGHEFSAEVAEVGADVSGISVGDEVVLPPSGASYDSIYSRSISHLGGGPRHGFHAEWGFTSYGAFTTYGVFDAERVVKLPENVDVEEAALVEPLSVATRGVLNNSNIQPTDVVVVSGAGPIGQLAAQLAKAHGATVIVLGVGVDEHRLALAESLGADLVLNVEEKDPLSDVLDLTHGAGADAVFECAGVEASMSKCIEIVRRGGRYVQIATAASRMNIDFVQIAYKELTVKGSLGSTRVDWERALSLISSGKVQTKPLISHKLPISAWEEAFTLAEEKRSVKVLLYPEE